MRLNKVLVAVCAGLATVALGTTAATAAEPGVEDRAATAAEPGVEDPLVDDPLVEDPILVTSEMTVLDIDAEQAARAGNRVKVDGDFRVLIDGRTGEEIARVPRPGKRGEVGVQNTGYGNCGSSYFYLRDYSGTDFYYYTGFSVRDPAYKYDWNGYVSGEWYGGEDNLSFDFGGGLAFRTSWTSGRKYSTQDSPNFGVLYYGRVTSGTAWLVDGTVCYSGYPNDGRYLYRY